MGKNYSQEIFEYVKNFEFNEYNGFTEQDVDNFVSGIDIHRVPEFDYESGATKLVIIPENRDYVIKIPFTGILDWGDEGDRTEYIPFYGAEDDGWGDDYCRAEEMFYEMAEKAGYEEFFMPIYCEGTMRGHSIYTQEKVDIFVSHCSIAEQEKYSSKESKQKVKDKNYPLPKLWLASCLTAFGEDEEKLNNFLDFLEKTGMNNDLHSGNLGFFKGRPIIIDYGGFHD